MFVKQLVNQRQPRSPSWTTRGMHSQNPSCERRGPDAVHSLNPIWMISWFPSLPFPLCHFRALIAVCLLNQLWATGQCWPTSTSAKVGHWKHSLWSDTDWAFGLETKLKVPAGKKESHSTWEKKVYKDEQKAKYEAESFHKFWNTFLSPFWSLFS